VSFAALPPTRDLMGSPSHGCTGNHKCRQKKAKGEDVAADGGATCGMIGLRMKAMSSFAKDTSRPTFDWRGAKQH